MPSKKRKRKRKELTKIGAKAGQSLGIPGKYLLQSYHGGYVNIKSFLIPIQAADKTNSP